MNPDNGEASRPSAELPRRAVPRSIGDRAFTQLSYDLDRWFLLRDQRGQDYGIDAEVEPVVGRVVTGRIAKLQVKGTDIPRSADRPFSIRVKARTLRYWLEVSAPVGVIVVDLRHGRYFLFDGQLTARQRLAACGKTASLRCDPSRAADCTGLQEWLVDLALRESDWRMEAYHVGALVEYWPLVVGCTAWAMHADFHIELNPACIHWLRAAEDAVAGARSVRRILADQSLAETHLANARETARAVPHMRANSALIFRQCGLYVYHLMCTILPELKAAWLAEEWFWTAKAGRLYERLGCIEPLAYSNDDAFMLWAEDQGYTQLALDALSISERQRKPDGIEFYDDFGLRSLTH